jgi:hypothetical protein
MDDLCAGADARAGAIGSSALMRDVILTTLRYVVPMQNPRRGEGNPPRNRFQERASWQAQRTLSRHVVCLLQVRHSTRGGNHA